MTNQLKPMGHRPSSCPLGRMPMENLYRGWRGSVGCPMMSRERGLSGMELQASIDAITGAGAAGAGLVVLVVVWGGVGEM